MLILPPTLQLPTLSSSHPLLLRLWHSTLCVIHNLFPATSTQSQPTSPLASTPRDLLANTRFFCCLFHFWHIRPFSGSTRLGCCLPLALHTLLYHLCSPSTTFICHSRRASPVDRGSFTHHSLLRFLCLLASLLFLPESFPFTFLQHSPLPPSPAPLFHPTVLIESFFSTVNPDPLTLLPLCFMFTSFCPSSITLVTPCVFRLLLTRRFFQLLQFGWGNIWPLLVVYLLADPAFFWGFFCMHAVLKKWGVDWSQSQLIKTTLNITVASGFTAWAGGPSVFWEGKDPFF